MYPPTAAHAEGKLRLLYEANPIVYIAEQVGGIALDGDDRVLDVQPRGIHQRTRLVVGGREEMTEFTRQVSISSQK